MPTQEFYQRQADAGGKHAKLFQGMAEWAAEQLSQSPLTEGETGVLTFLKAGYTRVDTAHALGVSEAMISKHIGSVWRKLGHDRKTDACLFVCLSERGWL